MASTREAQVTAVSEMRVDSHPGTCPVACEDQGPLAFKATGAVRRAVASLRDVTAGIADVLGDRLSSALGQLEPEVASGSRRVRRACQNGRLPCMDDDDDDCGRPVKSRPRKMPCEDARDDDDPPLFRGRGISEENTLASPRASPSQGGPPLEKLMSELFRLRCPDDTELGEAEFLMLCERARQLHRGEVAGGSDSLAAKQEQLLRSGGGSGSSPSGRELTRSAFCRRMRAALYALGCDDMTQANLIAQILDELQAPGSAPAPAPAPALPPTAGLDRSSLSATPASDVKSGGGGKPIRWVRHELGPISERTEPPPTQRFGMDSFDEPL